MEKIVTLPKIISAKKHEVLDYLTLEVFLLVGGIWWRNKRKSSIAALAKGLFLLGYTPFTDYGGRGQKPISFRTHGKLDRLQAGAAIGPKLLGFSDENTAYFFRAQAVNETLVLAMTDVEAAEPGLTRFKGRKNAA